MSLVGFAASNHRQQIRRRGPRPEIDDRATPSELFDQLNGRFRFTLDVAASVANAKCGRFFTCADDGLEQSWSGQRVWCNPPFSDVRPWIEKAWLETDMCPVIVMLLPANRTEQVFWQELVEPYRDRPGQPLRVEFVANRRRFIAYGSSKVGPNERPPFGVCLLIWQQQELVGPDSTPKTLSRKDTD